MTRSNRLRGGDHFGYSRSRNQSFTINVRGEP